MAAGSRDLEYLIHVSNVLSNYMYEYIQLSRTAPHKLDMPKHPTSRLTIKKSRHKILEPVQIYMPKIDKTRYVYDSKECENFICMELYLHLENEPNISHPPTHPPSIKSFH